MWKRNRLTVKREGWSELLILTINVVYHIQPSIYKVVVFVENTVFSGIM